ncbi:MAG: copper transporter [Acidobacteria bacterium]|nr:copper transporter [Acidobacteriota bacterium]
MINFRFHLVSLVAVFLALGIGVIVGSAVIDSAVVDQLRSQQSTLSHRIDQVDGENSQLRGELKDLRDTERQLSKEGGERLLRNDLAGAPVLVLAVRGIDPEPLKELVAQLATAGATYRGTVWLTDRFQLDDSSEVKDLSASLGLPEQTDVAALRSSALLELAAAWRPRTPEATDDASRGPALLASLRERGFLDVEAAPDSDGKIVPGASIGTRLLLVSGPAPAVADEDLALPLAEELVNDRPGRLGASLVAATTEMPEDPPGATLIGGLRGDAVASRRLSTVDDLGVLAGRLAAVLALVDLGQGRVGHFGRAPGAQRLIPAPASPTGP